MTENFNHGKIKYTNLSDEMKTSFLDYSMSVIVSRALPDVRDGLKPVHRRILYAMNDLGITADKSYKKSARIVGEVIGKYHPHGDSAVYDSMVRMAQDFSYRYPLVDGHGNFGSIDGDGAAAMRYTEARMSKVAMELVKDIQKDTIDWQENYDGEEKEPSILPSKFPNLLLNGGTGIAVGMATNMAPHNFREVIDGVIAQIDNPEISVLDLMENYIKGPDFPTGSYILGKSGIKKAYETGKGSVIMRSKCEIDMLDNGKPRIIVKEIPYAINKANLVEKIANLVKEKIVDGITDLRDESNRNGIRIVIECRRDIQPEVLLNQLYKSTPLQTSFSINNIVLVKGTPMLLGLKDLIKYYIDHQVEVTTRKIQFELKKAEDRMHILSGLIIALDNLDAIIEIIRHSKDASEALPRLMNEFSLSEIQAKSILDMQLRRLTGLERQKILDEYAELEALVANYRDILANHDKLMAIIKEELTELKEKYGDDRRSKIIESDFDMDDEDLIPVEDIVVTMTINGYIKRVVSDTYKVQNRGGRGKQGMRVNEDDIIDQLINMSTHDYLLLFTNFGKVYRIKGYQVPSADRTSKGIPVVNLLPLEKEEKVNTLVVIKRENEEHKYLFFTTKKGIVKRCSIEEFDSIRKNGKIAITLQDDDQLERVRLTTGDDEIIIAASNGRAVRFSETKVRIMGRTAKGIKGFNTEGSDVIGMSTSNEGNLLLTVSENGYGKKSELSEYRLTNRGGKGVMTMRTTEKTGKLVSMRSVTGDEDCLIVTETGVIIRISLKQVPVNGRVSQGVKMINLDNDTKVSKITLINESGEELIEKEDE